MFRVGQKVVCVDDTDTTVVKKGEIYTISRVGLSPILQIPVIGIVGISSSDSGMYARRFRPIVERKTDISIFTKMVKTEHINA